MSKMLKESRISLFSRTILSPSYSSSTYSSVENYSDDESDDDDSDEDESEDLESLTVKEEHNAIKWVINNEAYCFDIKKFSEKLVEATFIEANRQLNYKPKTWTIFDIVGPVLCDIVNQAVTFSSDSPCVSPVNSCYDDHLSSSYGSSLRSLIEWPKVSEFNIKLGLEKVEEYVSTWEISSSWLFCVEFLGFESEDCSNIFVYEVEWSKPTNSYPIPQATASVYFALEVFKMVPYNYDRSIEVTYIFESSNVIHIPGKIDFQEKWLQDILDAKLKFFKAITFSVPVGYCSFLEKPQSD